MGTDSDPFGSFFGSGGTPGKTVEARSEAHTTFDGDTTDFGNGAHLSTVAVIVLAGLASLALFVGVGLIARHR